MCSWQTTPTMRSRTQIGTSSIAPIPSDRKMLLGTMNMPASAMDNPFAQQQKILLYVFPLVFAVTGVNFPIGVLL